MGIVVFDSDVLIGYLDAGDAHHAAAVAVMATSMAEGTRRLLCAVTYSEVLVGPIRAGRGDVFRQMMAELAIQVVPVDSTLAEEAAAVRVVTRLRLPDAYVLATAAVAAARERDDVRVESFDRSLLKAHAARALRV